ncbi:MAG: CopG family transcriptional regulator [Gammaproteobacteria bacterium]
MHRTQIYLQDELYQQLKARSQSSGLSVSELIRRTLVKDLQARPAEDARAFFERITPLESFSDVEPKHYVRALRDNSRLLKVLHDSTA